MSWNSRSRFRPFALAALLLALAAASAPSAPAHEGHDGPEAGPNDPRAPRRLSEAAIRNGGITLSEVALQAVERVLTVPGVVAPRPDAMFDLHAPMDGILLEVTAVAGKTVKAGEVLARLGGPAVAGLVSEWDRLAKEAVGAEQARFMLADLVQREVIQELESRRVGLLVAAATQDRTRSTLEATTQAGAGLPARERVLRETEEREARVRLDGERVRLLSIGLSLEELARIEKGAADAGILSLLGLEPGVAVERFRAVAPHAADLLEHAKETQSAAASLHGAELRIRLTGLSLDDVRAVVEGRTEPSVPLRTPLAGVVREVLGNRGHWVAAGAEIASLLDPQKTQVEAWVPEGDFGRFDLGATARVRRGGREDVRLDGVVRIVGAAVDPETRRVPIVVEVGEASALPVGLGVDVTIVLEALPPSKAVPRAAVLVEGADRYVYKAKDGAFVRTDVVVGAGDDRFVQILDGLYTGEKVVATGADLVRDTPPLAEPPKK